MELASLVIIVCEECFFMARFIFLYFQLVSNNLRINFIL